jgi:prevent-host-death family protein
MAKSEEGRAERGARSAEGRHSYVSSTEAQNALGEILARVSQGERVFVTRYGRRQAVILSAEAYHGLVGEEAVDLVGLEREFDEMLERMQTPEHAAATEELFGMSEEELGKAAAARTRGEQAEAAGP